MRVQLKKKKELVAEPEMDGNGFQPKAFLGKW